MNTVSKAFIAAIIFSLAFVGGFLLGSNKEIATKVYETPSQSSVIIIDSAGGNSISVTQDGIADTVSIKVKGKNIHQQMNGSGDNVAGDKVINQ